MTLLFLVYFIFFQIVPLFAFIYSFFQLFFYYVNIPYIWSKICIKFAGCKVFLIDKSHELYMHPTKRCIYLPNHRDIYDFPIDTYITGGSGMFISRYLVMFAFPIQYIMSAIAKNTFYFKKNFIHDKIKFNKTIYESLVESNCRNLIIYPEGTRRNENTLIPIKKGATHIAWTYNMCVQIIITKNKEDILNLKTLTSKYGVNLYCYRSEVINPEYFTSFEEFNSYVCLTWENSWKKIYECKEADFIYRTLEVEPYNIKYSNLFFLFYNILPLIALLYWNFIYTNMQK